MIAKLNDRDQLLDSKVASELNSNERYYQMLQEWHDLHGGLAVEADMKQRIEQGCRAGAAILEAGCGSGAITNWFSSHYSKVQFVGVDISQIGIDMARTKALENTRYETADLKKLPFENNQFDLVFSQSVLEHVVGWELAVREMHRVIAPGGKLLIRVENAGVSHAPSLLHALFNYLTCRNRSRTMNPSFELREGAWDDHESNFDVQGIPSDVLLRVMRNEGFAISYFTTGTDAWRASKELKPLLISYLNFFPFNHLGWVTIVEGTKKR